MIIGAVALYVIVAIIAFVWLYENDESVWWQIAAAALWPLLVILWLAQLLGEAE